MMLNGAQVKALTDLIAQYSAGTLDRGQTKAILVHTLGISETAANQILG
jgi:hypothetical protein